jgi:hypothetical protein
MRKKINLYYLFLVTLFLVVGWVLADIIIEDAQNNNYNIINYNEMIELGNISNLPDGGNSYHQIVSGSYDENYQPTENFNAANQLETTEKDLIISADRNQNFESTQSNFPLDMNNEDNLPFGGYDNDPNLLISPVIIPEW